MANLFAVRGCAVFAAVWLALSPSGAEPLLAVIQARDRGALETLSRQAATPDERRLAHGAALALRGQDEAATAILKDLAQSSGNLQAGACMVLSDIYLRQSRFAEAHAALARVHQVVPLTGEALQVLAWTDILAAEPPMQLAGRLAGVLDAYQDSAGLTRVPVTINGESEDAVIDTDASFSVISESAARRLGVRVLEKGATILTSTRPDLPMHLGIADALQFGGAVFRHVVFVVLPDHAVRFAHGYKMDVVVGLPVFVALGRIELAKEGGWQRLYYGPQPERAMAAETGAPNMLLSGLDPYAVVQAGKTGAPLRLAIDTAATNTTLNATALRDFPALSEGASRSWAQWEGGGGTATATDAKAYTLSELDLAVAGRPVTVKRVKILSTPEPDRHGAIGQDLLKQAKRWVIDFATMRFTVGE